MCKLFEEMEEVRGQLNDYKKKAKEYDKVVREKQKVEEDLENVKEKLKSRDKENNDLKRKMEDMYTKLKSLQDSNGNNEDALAAAEFKAQGLEKDLKKAEKEIEMLKGLQMQAKLGIGDKDEVITQLNQDKEKLQRMLDEKDTVIEKKEKLISEYKRDIERERREKAD